MTIKISDKILKRAKLTEKELLLTIAIQLFKEEKVTLADASKLAQLHQIQFQKELAKRKISIHYGDEELQADMETISRLNL